MEEVLQQTTTITTLTSSTTTITQIIQNLGETSKFYTPEL
jgi:hypothetical protein